VRLACGSAALAAALAVASSAGGASSVLRLRSVSAHGYANLVRATLAFQGGRIGPGSVFAPDPTPYTDGSAAVRVNGARGQARLLHVGQTSIRVSQIGTRLLVRFAAPARRFKYFGYSFSQDRERLALNLWKSTPPATPAPVGAARCLVLRHWAVGAGSATARGTEQGLFEHMFVLRIRDRRGKVLATDGVAANSGRWHAQIAYHVARAQAGTLEAVDTSEADGSVVCIAQARVMLRP